MIVTQFNPTSEVCPNSQWLHQQHDSQHNPTSGVLPKFTLTTSTTSCPMKCRKWALPKFTMTMEITFPNNTTLKLKHIYIKKKKNSYPKTNLNIIYSDKQYQFISNQSETSWDQPYDSSNQQKNNFRSTNQNYIHTWTLLQNTLYQTKKKKKKKVIKNGRSWTWIIGKMDLRRWAQKSTLNIHRSEISEEFVFIRKNDLFY